MPVDYEWNIKAESTIGKAAMRLVTRMEKEKLVDLRTNGDITNLLDIIINELHMAGFDADDPIL